MLMELQFGVDTMVFICRAAMIFLSKTAMCIQVMTASQDMTTMMSMLETVK